MEHFFCTLLMRPWVQPFGGDGYCVWTYTSTPSEGLPWWIWALGVVLVLFVVAVLLPDPAKKPERGTTAIMPYEEPPQSLMVDELIHFRTGDKILITDNKGTREGMARKDVSIGKRNRKR